MTPMTSAPPLDGPLPLELTGRAHGWFTRYRRYPVFSRPWARGRVRSVALVVGLVLLLVVARVLGNDAQARPWSSVLDLAIGMVVPMLAGPWLGSVIRRRRWPQRVEGWALAAAIVAVVGAMALFENVAAGPMKHWVAAHTGELDERGQRRDLVLTLGVDIAEPGRPGGKAMRDEDAMLASPEAANVSTLFRGLISFLLAGGLALRGWMRERDGLAALQRERALTEAQAQRREAELRLSVLAAQVEPHFLFNTLAGVRGAIATDPVRASEMIDRLADYLRAAIPRLRSDGSAQATVGAQFELVRAYLGLMAARMSRLAFSVDAPAELLAARCPPLMLISLAENAVKHGVEPKIGPARVDVSARRDDDGRLALVVEDDGVGFGASAAGSGIGLSNLRERLAQLYGARATLTLKARPGGGVAATLSLPLETSP